MIAPHPHSQPTPEPVRHTPTPWDCKRARFPTDGEYDCGISAVIDGKPRCIAETFGRCAPEIKLDAEANAAFIVTAVNSHAALTSRVEELENVRIDDICELGMMETRRNAAVKALQEIEQMPFSMVNDSESLRHTIRTIQSIASRAALQSGGGK